MVSTNLLFSVSVKRFLSKSIDFQTMKFLIVGLASLDNFETSFVDLLIIIKNFLNQCESNFDSYATTVSFGNVIGEAVKLMIRACKFDYFAFTVS